MLGDIQYFWWVIMNYKALPQVHSTWKMKFPSPQESLIRVQYATFVPL